MYSGAALWSSDLVGGMLALHRCASIALVLMVSVPLCRSKPCGGFALLSVVGAERQEAIV